MSIQVEVFEWLFELSRAHEQWQLDEILALVMVLGICFGVYGYRRWRELSRVVREVRTLQGIVPICARCKKIRDDAGYWQHVETYVRDHTYAEFSHGVCPECAAELYPEMCDPEAHSGTCEGLRGGT